MYARWLRLLCAEVTNRMRSCFSATAGDSSPRKRLGLRRRTSRKLVGASIGRSIDRPVDPLEAGGRITERCRRQLTNLAHGDDGVGSADDDGLQLGERLHDVGAAHAADPAVGARAPPEGKVRLPVVARLVDVHPTGPYAVGELEASAQ